MYETDRLYKKLKEPPFRSTALLPDAVVCLASDLLPRREAPPSDAALVCQSSNCLFQVLGMYDSAGAR